MKNAELGRVPALDGLRGIAILLVMFHHCTILPAQGGWIVEGLRNLSNIGPHGVDLFFVLSGFLITGILLDTKSLPGYFRKFYIRRALRIFPLYYAIVLFCLLALPSVIAKVPSAAPKLGRLAAAPSDWPWFVFYLSNFLISGRQSWAHPVLGVTWSLAIEEQFYLVWAVIVFCFSRQMIKRLAIAFLTTSLCLRSLLFIGGFPWIQLYVLPWCRMDGLALGALIAVSLRDGTDYPRRFGRSSKPVAAAITGAFICIYACGLSTYFGGSVITIGYTFVSFACAAWLCWVLNSQADSGRTQDVLESRVLLTFGKYSYAIYLLHLPIRAALRDMLFRSPRVTAALGDGLLWQFVFYLVSGAAALCAALISWNLLERPCLQLKDRIARYDRPAIKDEKTARATA